MAFVMIPICAKWLYVLDKAPSFTSRNHGTFHIYGDKVKRLRAVLCCMLHSCVFSLLLARAPSTSAVRPLAVGQGPSGPDWLATALGFWSGRVLATGTAWAGLCLIHHHHFTFGQITGPPARARRSAPRAVPSERGWAITARDLGRWL